MSVLRGKGRAALAVVLLIAALNPAFASPSEDDDPPRSSAVGGQVLWQTNGVALSLADDYQGAPRLAPDGAGGVIAVWTDTRPTADGADIYAQRLDAAGTALWAANGIPVASAANNQTEPQAISDGAGGALVAWNDERGARIAVYAQRLDPAGKALWAGAGISVTAGASDFLLAQLVPDGSGGAFVIWEEDANPDRFDTNLFAQRISATGALQFTAPVTITVAPGEQFDAVATADGSGGCIVVWADLRDAGDQNLYAQRIAGNGAILWTAAGAAVSTDPALQGVGPIVADGQGGVFVSWYDLRSSGTLADAYLMRVTAAGARAWLNDLPVMASSALTERPTDLVADGSGGVILVAAASDPGNPAAGDVVAQRVDADAALLWGAQPVTVTLWAEQQDSAAATPDGHGGVYLAWRDRFNDLSGDIMAQHLNDLGAAQWAGHGVEIVTLTGAQDNLRVIGDDAQGLIVAWQDYRSAPNHPDLFAQRVSDRYQIIFPLIRKHSH